MSARPHWITAPGFYPDMGELEYFADPCPAPSLRQSGIKVLDGRSPYHFAYQHPRLNPYRQARAPTRFMIMGSAVHSLALGRGKEVSLIRYPDYRNPSAIRARDAALGAGRIPVLEREHDRAQVGAAIVRRAIEDELEGAEYFTEVPVFWTEETPFGPIWCGAMLDVWCPSRATALDVKFSSVFATPEAVGRDMASNGYDVQNSWYRRALAANVADFGGRFRFGTLYVEDQAPHGYSVFELDDGSAHVAEGVCNRAVKTFARCLYARSWPSYPAHQTTSTPPYHHQAATLRQLAEED